MTPKYDFEFFKESADYIKSKINKQPELALILGSCLGGLADEIKNKTILDYAEIPNFLHTTVQSHAGKLIFGELHGKNVVCMSGRFHYYEGYDFEELVAPIRVLSLLGIKTVVLTNAAGAINTSYNVGDIMLIRDHIQMMGVSPMRGANIPEFGERFFDASNIYAKHLRNLVKKAAGNAGISIQEGVYFYAVGPHFETPAEIRAMRILGADAVGMSTVTEALTAAHCKMQVIGLSLMSNMAAGVLDAPITVEEVDATAELAGEKFKQLIREILKNI